MIRPAQGFHIKNIRHHLINRPSVAQCKPQQFLLLRGQVVLRGLKQAQCAGQRGEGGFHFVAHRGDKLVFGALKLALLAHVSHDAEKAQMLTEIGFNLGS
nr:hypothetical protein [Sulfitobacter indolifex]